MNHVRTHIAYRTSLPENFDQSSLTLVDSVHLRMHSAVDAASWETDGMTRRSSKKTAATLMLCEGLDRDNFVESITVCPAVVTSNASGEGENRPASRKRR